MPSADAPLAGLRVVEVAAGVSDLGMGMATALPGLLFADHGAEVVRVAPPAPSPLDASLQARHVWDRGKELVPLDTGTDDGVVALRDLLAAADVAVVAGSARLDEGPLAYEELARTNSGLVHCRVGPSRVLGRDVADHDVLVLAAGGVLANLRGHRPGPVFCSFPLASYGAGLAVMGGALAALAQREVTGRGQRVETSLADGLAAMLAMQVSEGERLEKMMWTYQPRTEETASARSTSWQYPCADGEWIEIHPGAKGAYERINSLLGVETTSMWWDFRSEEAFERERQWSAAFARKPRDEWLAEMWAADVPAQPVLDPGVALSDEHAMAIGLSVEQPGPDGAPIRAVGQVVTTTPVGPARARLSTTGRVVPAPLTGLKVLDFGYFFAGPHGDMLLADLGADVVKVEGVEGDPLRFTSESFVACQRGKRSLALDLKSPDARPVLERLFGWADVVHHNFRPGVPERLGIDEASVRAVNPAVVYAQSPAFGSGGPKSSFPGFDPLIQALVGVEKHAGGEGNGPMYVTTAPFDMGGAWLSAIAMLLAVYASRRTGVAQSAETSLLAAGLLGTSGVFLRDGEPVLGPSVDRAQTGYGPAYRIFEAADGEWLAVVVPDEAAWARLRSVPGLDGLPAPFVALRAHDAAGAAAAEAAMEAAFATRPAAEWLAALGAAGVPCAPIVPLTEIPRILHDEEALAAGRVVAYDDRQYGRMRQIGAPYRFSTGPLTVRRGAPGVGEHSEEVLAELRFTADDVAALVDKGVVRVMEVEE